MRKKLVFFALALAAVATTSFIPPAAATTCPPGMTPVYCDGFIRCCDRFEVCMCP